MGENQKEPGEMGIQSLFDCYVAVSFSVRISYKMLGKSLPDLIS
jgi:hypothetical protein